MKRLVLFLIYYVIVAPSCSYATSNNVKIDDSFSFSDQSSTANNERLNNLHYNEETHTYKITESKNRISNEYKSKTYERLLVTDCSSLDYQACIQEVHCKWCIADDCGIDKCIDSDELSIKYKEMFVSADATYQNYCPHSIDLAKQNYDIKYLLKAVSITSSCQWNITNSKGRKLRIQIPKTYLSILLCLVIPRIFVR